MKRTKIVETSEDLFSAAVGAETPEPMALIASPLVAETAGWLENRACRHLGVVGVPTAETGRISVVEGNLTFKDLELSNATEKAVDRGVERL